MNIDTGVFPSVLDPSVAANLSLEMSDPAGFIVGGGPRQIPFRRALLESARLGEFVLDPLPIIVAETRHFIIGGQPIHGTLGASFFRSSVVQIDYPSRLLRLSSRTKGQRSQPRANVDRAQPVAVDVNGHTPRLKELMINGRRVSGWMDTGASNGIVLSERTAVQLGLGTALENGDAVNAIGTRGEMQATLIVIDSVTVSGFTVRDLHGLVVAQSPTYIGNEFWQEFVVTIDYAEQSVRLSPPF